MGLLGLALLLLSIPSGPARSVDYNVVPYYNPICFCCVEVGKIQYEMFTATGLYSGQNDLQNWFYIEQMFKNRIEPALQNMADNLRGTVTTHIAMIGAFLDGQTTNFAQSTVQKLNAETIKDYNISDQICRFGTLSRSLSQSEAKSKAAQLGLMKQIVDRQFMHLNSNSGSVQKEKVTFGRSSDKEGRWKLYKEKFCDSSDGGGALAAGAEKCAATTNAQLNRDIDMTRTLDTPDNLDIDFTSAAATPDEENIFALSNNLYGHDIPTNFGHSDMLQMTTSAKDGQIRNLMNFRSVVAKRSVAANSFAAIAALKSNGSAGNKTYLEAVVKELGLTSTEEMKNAVGDNPSYYAQMNFLTRKIYQSPNFYANLYDSPQNVARQQVALEAINLMQDRDIFESLRRNEMLMSMMLELYVEKEQNRIANKGVK